MFFAASRPALFCKRIGQKPVHRRRSKESW